MTRSQGASDSLRVFERDRRPREAPVDGHGLVHLRLQARARAARALEHRVSHSGTIRAELDDPVGRGGSGLADAKQSVGVDTHNEHMVFERRPMRAAQG